MHYFVTFIAGFLIEACCVGWVHFSERDRALTTALCSMMIALAQVTGIGAAISNKVDATAFVLGYGVGTFTSVKYKKWRKA